MPCARPSRTVVAVSFLDLLAFMRAEGVKHLKAQNVGAFFQRASQGVLTKLYKAAKVFHATVGPREVLYMPYAIVVAENVRADKDVLGLRVPLLPVLDRVAQMLALMEEYLTALKDVAGLSSLGILRAALLS